MHGDRDRAGPLTTPFGEPGPSPHAPRDDNTKARPMKQTKPSANTRKYDAATKAQDQDQDQDQDQARGYSLRWELSRKAGLTHIVKTLYDRGQRMPSAPTVVHLERGNPLLEDVTAKDQNGLTPLQRALCKGLPRVVLTLLEQGADTTAPVYEGRTPLHWASTKGDLEVIRVLLDRGADTTAQDNDGWSPLHLAAEKGHERITIPFL